MDKEYVCTDSTTGAAIWKLTTGGGVGGLNWRGSWAISTSYAVDDGIVHNDASYICTSAHTSAAGDEPLIGGLWASYWDVLAAKNLLYF